MATDRTTGDVQPEHDVDEDTQQQQQEQALDEVVAPRDPGSAGDDLAGQPDQGGGEFDSGLPEQPQSGEEAGFQEGIDDILGTGGEEGGLPDSSAGIPDKADPLEDAVLPGRGDTGFDPNAPIGEAGGPSPVDPETMTSKPVYELASYVKPGQTPMLRDTKTGEILSADQAEPGSLVSWDTQQAGLLGASRFKTGDEGEVFTSDDGRAHMVVGYDGQLHEIGEGLGEKPEDQTDPAQDQADTTGTPEGSEGESPEEWLDWQQQLEESLHVRQVDIEAEQNAAIDPGEFGSGVEGTGKSIPDQTDWGPDGPPDTESGGTEAEPDLGAVDFGEGSMGEGGGGSDVDIVGEHGGPLGPGGDGVTQYQDGSDDPDGIEAMAEEQGLVESASDSGGGELPLPDLDIEGPENPTGLADVDGVDLGGP